MRFEVLKAQRKRLTEELAHAYQDEKLARWIRENIEVNLAAVTLELCELEKFYDVR